MTTCKPQSPGLIAFMRSRASGKVVLLLFFMTTAVYLTMLLVTIPRVQDFSPNSALFDLSPLGYSHQQAMFLLESLGQEGRKAYLFPQLALDFVYPGLFAINYSLMLIWIYSKRIRAESKFFYLALLPAFAGLFDYLENILIIRIIMKYPLVSEDLVTAASSITIVKSALTMASFLLLLIGFAFFLKGRTLKSLQVKGSPRNTG